MGCKGCGKSTAKSDVMRSAGVMEPDRATIVKCPHGHKLLIVELQPEIRCTKYNHCKIPEKHEEYCGPDCTEWSDELQVKLQCPICNTSFNLFYNDNAVRILPYPNNKKIAGIEAININDNTVSVKLQTMEVVDAT